MIELNKSGEKEKKRKTFVFMLSSAARLLLPKKEEEHNKKIIKSFMGGDRSRRPLCALSFCSVIWIGEAEAGELVWCGTLSGGLEREPLCEFSASTLCLGVRACVRTQLV